MLEIKADCAAQHCNDFVHGLTFLKESSVTQALENFQRAYDAAPVDDIYHNKYASFCGLTRVLSGDISGIGLCRQAVKQESIDGDVFLNLAYAEWHLKSRRRSIMVLEKGLHIDKQHPGLNRFKNYLGVRSKTVIAFIPRNSFLNKALGKISRKSNSMAESCTLQKLLQ